MSEQSIKYYSLTYDGFWSPGYKTFSNGRQYPQDVQWPWLLSYEEVVAWIKRDWFNEFQTDNQHDIKWLRELGYDIQEHTPEYIQKAKDHFFKEIDQERRFKFAMQYL